MHNIEAKEKYPNRIHETGELLTAQFMAGETEAAVDYLKVTPEAMSGRGPVIIVPGFTEGIVQDAKFAHYLSQEMGAGVFVPGQYEREKKGKMTRDEAIDNQAEAILAIIEDQGLQKQGVNIFANSLGAPVFVRAAELARERVLNCFGDENGSSVVFMAPVGMKPDDRKRDVAKRFVKGSMIDVHNKEKHGWDKDSLDAGLKLAAKDPLKAGSEMHLAASVKIYADNLKPFGIRPHILTSPRDVIFGQEALGETLITQLEAGQIASWSTPWMQDVRYDSSPADKAERVARDFGKSSGAEHNTHMVNDHQAERTARAVANLLKL